MSTPTTAEPTARKRVAGHIDFADNKTDAGVLRTHPAPQEKLTPEEQACLWEASKDDDDFTDKAIAFGKLTGDFTIDRHILPQPTLAEIYAGATRIEAEHPERFSAKQVR